MSVGRQKIVEGIFKNYTTKEIKELIINQDLENKKLRLENEQLKKLPAVMLGQEFITLKTITADIPLDRLEKICKAVKYIGQTGYAVCTDLEDNLIVAPVEINKIEISDNNIWIKGTGSCEFYTLAVIGYLIFFGENAKQLAESKYNELTAQGEL